MVLMVVDVTTGVTEEDLAVGQGHPAGRRRRCGWWSTRSTTPTGRPPPGSSSRSGSATRSRSAPCTGGAPGDLLDEVVGLLPARTARTTPPDELDGTGRLGPPGATGASPARPGWPSSAGPTSASRRSSTGCWARSARSSTTCRAPRATPSTPWSRRRTARSASSTPPACGGRPRPTAAPSSTPCCAPCDALERADIAVLVIDATVGASHQDQRLAERIGVSGCPAIVVLNKWDLVPTDERDDVLAGVGDRLAFLGAAPGAQDLGARRARASTASCRRCATPSRPTTSGCPTGALNRALQEIQGRQPAPRAQDPLHRPGCHRPADLHPLHQRAAAPDLHPLHRAGSAGEVRLRRDADEATGPDRREMRNGPT